MGCTITNSNILLQSYHKIQYFTTKCDIIPQCVTFGVVFPMDYSTTIDIVPQSVAFYYKVWYFPWIILKRIVVFCYKI